MNRYRVAEMFGCAMDVRSATQGRGALPTRFARYKQVPHGAQEEVIAKAKELARTAEH